MLPLPLTVAFNWHLAFQHDASNVSFCDFSLAGERMEKPEPLCARQTPSPVAGALRWCGAAPLLQSIPSGLQQYLGGAPHVQLENTALRCICYSIFLLKPTWLQV